MIEKSITKGKSPITQALEEIEKEHRKLLQEEKTEERLYFKDE